MTAEFITSTHLPSSYTRLSPSCCELFPPLGILSLPCQTSTPYDASRLCRRHFHSPRAVLSPDLAFLPPPSFPGLTPRRGRRGCGRGGPTTIVIWCEGFHRIWVFPSAPPDKIPCDGRRSDSSRFIHAPRSLALLILQGRRWPSSSSASSSPPSPRGSPPSPPSPHL